MKPFIAFGLAIAASLSLSGIAGAQDHMGSMSGMSADALTIKLAAQNDSGETGTATLTQKGDDLLVVLNLTGAGDEAQPNHIHKGTCAKLDPKPLYPLTPAVNGKSETTLKGVKLSDLTAGKFAINVHKSVKDVKVYTACGDIAAAK